jgi:hypothetical protein
MVLRCLMLPGAGADAALEGFCLPLADWATSYHRPAERLCRHRSKADSSGADRSIAQIGALDRRLPLASSSARGSSARESSRYPGLRA